MVRGLIELHVHMERYNLGDEAESIQYYLSSIVNRVRAECVRIGFNYEGGFDEVHRSNMSKLWTLLESKKYAEWCMNENQPHDLTFRSVANVNPNDTALKCLVANRRSDNKVIKSPSYSPANLEKFFYAQG